MLPPNKDPQVGGIDDDELNEDNDGAANDNTHEALENEGMAPDNDDVEQATLVVFRRPGRVLNTRL